MPTHVALKVRLEPLANQIVCFLLLVHAVANEPLHGQCFPMFWKLLEHLRLQGNVCSKNDCVCVDHTWSAALMPFLYCFVS